MNRFLLKIAFFSMLSVLSVVSVLYVVNCKVSENRYYKVNKNITNLILGHSHSECAYDTDLIPGALNLAQSGEQYLYTYVKLKKITESNPQIKNVFVEFTFNNLDFNNVERIWGDSFINSRHPAYSPLFSSEEYQALFEHNFRKEILIEGKSLKDKINFLYHGNSKLAGGELGQYKKLKRFKTDSLLKQPLKKHKIAQLSALNIIYLHKIADYCNSKQIKLYLIRSPLHPNYEYRVNEKLFQDIRKKHFPKVAFIDFMDFKIENAEFADFGHLNYKGAHRFSFFYNAFLNKKTPVVPTNSIK